MKVKTKITCIIPGKGIFEQGKVYELEDSLFDEIFFEKLQNDKIEEEQGDSENANRNRKTRN